MVVQALVYQRILLKCSGGALSGQANQAIDPKMLERMVQEIIAIVKRGVEIGVVVGGGNLFRGKTLSGLGIDRITADQIGMLATVMNALALRDCLQRHRIAVRVMSAFEVGGLVERFERYRAIQYLQQQQVVIFAGGTGNPLVSTDLAASLRGLEIGAQILLKATSVAGIFSADPMHDPHALLYRHLTYQQVIAQELAVMDLAAFCQCRDHRLPIRVFNIYEPNALLAILQGKQLGTLVSDGS